MSYEDMLVEHKKLMPAACTLGVKHVENPRHYGVVEERDGVVTRMVEKPEQPATDLAIAGVYLVEDTPLLWSCIEKVMERNKAGNYQLTDALQLMVEAGAQFKTFEVPDWYDCGRPEMLLEINQILLDKYGSDNQGVMRRCVLIDPVQIGKNCKLEDSIIGPHVSIAEGTTVKNSIIKETIIGSNSEIQNMLLKASIINDEVVMHGRGQTVNVGENSEIKMV
jgi:glucose-1-phosphate thymidylyltransferase